MANPTTNYGFVLPTPTDLVTDLPADFDVALQGVDTQMLTNANAAIAKTIVDAKGDIIAATAADAVSRLAVGANNTVLTADSTTATGLKWVAGGTAFSGCSAFKATGQAIPNGTWTTLLFDTESFDTDTYHNDSTNKGRMTIPTGKAGYYEIRIVVESILDEVLIRLLKNGSVVALGLYAGYIYMDRAAANESMGNATFMLNLAAADYVEVQILNFAERTTNSQVFQIQYLGA